MRGAAPKELVGGQGECPMQLSARQGWDLSEQKTAQCLEDARGGGELASTGGTKEGFLEPQRIPEGRDEEMGA